MYYYGKGSNYVDIGGARHGHVTTGHNTPLWRVQSY
jgi:hypothetical protein